MTVGDKIRILRLHNNWTQKYLAQAIGVTELTIRNYESGKGGIRDRHIDKLCDVFEIDKSTLIGNRAENVNEVMQTLFFLRDEFGLRAASMEDIPAHKRNSILYFENDTLASFIESWKNKQADIGETPNEMELLMAWELLFPKSLAEDSALKLDMHRKRGKITSKADKVE